VLEKRLVLTTWENNTVVCVSQKKWCALQNKATALGTWICDTKAELAFTTREQFNPKGTCSGLKMPIRIQIEPVPIINIAFLKKSMGRY
jgi:hypothetical protein